MLVEKLLPATRKGLVTIADNARLIEAAKLLGNGTDLVVVCNPAGLLARRHHKAGCHQSNRSMSGIGLHNRRLIGDDAKRYRLRIRRLSKGRLVENEGNGG